MSAEVVSLGRIDGLETDRPLPELAYWRGVPVERMTREELLAAFRQHARYEEYRRRTGGQREEHWEWVAGLWKGRAMRAEAVLGMWFVAAAVGWVLALVLGVWLLVAQMWG